MLVLSRQKDESIIINDNVVVTIVDIRGDKVRLGIDAPIGVPVHRSEVYEAIKREESRENQKDNKGLAGGLDGTNIPGAPKTRLQRSYEILLLPGETTETRQYLRRLERGYTRFI